jgi:tetraacyldisaccharide 4'-kinase
MNILRKLLFPLGILYWLITYLRNVAYDKNWLKSVSYPFPVIAIGNLSVGGTGKTPHTEYLIKLLKTKKSIAVLSRGYGRKTKGYLLANEKTNAQDIGDEPFQMAHKFPNIQVAVCEDRNLGIQNLRATTNPEIILLDDAFQHRKVKAGFYVLLTTFSDLFVDDFILPFGNLRESAMGKKRANAVIVTKCPETLSNEEIHRIKQKLNVKVPVYFSKTVYDEYVYSENGKLSLAEVVSHSKAIVAGIAKPEYFVSKLKHEHDDVFIYPDHYDFGTEDVKKLEAIALTKKIITTEKDYMRLKSKMKTENLFYLPITISFLGESIDKQLLEFIGKD